MTSGGGYPLGAENDSRAPYNQVENPEEEIEVFVSITMSKKLTIKVKDYTIIDEGIDEDGNYYCDKDFSSCDLYGAVAEQHSLHAIPEGWHEDEFFVFQD